MFCLICVEKSVGGESELSTASRHCFGLGGPSLSTTESCSSSDSVAEQAGLRLKVLPDLPMRHQRASASFTDITRLTI